MDNKLEGEYVGTELLNDLRERASRVGLTVEEYIRRLVVNQDNTPTSLYFVDGFDRVNTDEMKRRWYGTKDGKPPRHPYDLGDIEE